MSGKGGMTPAVTLPAGVAVGQCSFRNTSDLHKNKSRAYTNYFKKNKHNFSLKKLLNYSTVSIYFIIRFFTPRAARTII